MVLNLKHFLSDSRSCFSSPDQSNVENQPFDPTIQQIVDLRHFLFISNTLKIPKPSIWSAESSAAKFDDACDETLV